MLNIILKNSSQEIQNFNKKSELFISQKIHICKGGTKTFRPVFQVCTILTSVRNHMSIIFLF